MRQPSTWELRIGIAATLGLFAMGVMLILLLGIFAKQAQDAQVLHLTWQAQDLAKAFEDNMQGQVTSGVLGAQLERISERQEAMLYIVNRYGMVLRVVQKGQESEPLAQLDDGTLMECLQQVLAQDQDVFIAMTPTEGLTIGVPLGSGYMPMGALFVQTRAPSWQDLFSPISTRIMIFLAFCWLCALTASLFFIWRAIVRNRHSNMIQMSDDAHVEQIRKDFVANVSHELRTPLASVQGYVQAMLDGTIGQERTPETLAAVLTQIKRMGHLVGDLLELSHLESQTYSLLLAKGDINEVVRRALISLQARIEEKQLFVEVVFREDPLFVLMDVARIEQVLIILLDNATKFLQDGGTLTLWTHVSQDQCYVTVKDNGKGIAPDDLPFIFDRFYRADKGRSAGEGVGLGLPIAQTIITGHGQKLQAISAQGQGATFIFTLALAQS